jgi:hypothetical protein
LRFNTVEARLRMIDEWMTNWKLALRPTSKSADTSWPFRRWGDRDARDT